MASTIVTKNSSTASAVPLTGDLTQGELAVNVTDKRLFTKNSGGTVVELGTNPASLALPNGTANGVAYLNGSKVVTTGSALTWDGSTLKVGGSGVSVLDDQYFYFAGGASYIQGSTASNYIKFGISSAEQMRLTSTGLGIGTSSPAYKLDVNGAGNFGTSTVGKALLGNTSGYPIVLTGRASDSFAYIKSLTGAGAVAGSFGFNSSGGFDVNVTSSETNALTVNSSGNLGIGVTPSAWRSGDRALDIGSTASLVDAQSANTRLYNNTFVATGGTNTYKITAAASYYDQGGGVHRWFNAASGTAGNAITFTQAMTLDANGVLLLGGTTSKVTGVSGSGSGQTISGSVPTLALWSGATSTNYFNLSQINTDTYVWNLASGFMAFGTGNTERARIDSSGNLLVGTTTAGASGAGVQLWNYTGTVGTSYIKKTASGTFTAIDFRYNGTAVGAINYSDTATAYATSSDYRLKNTVAPMTGALAKVAALKPVTYKWNSDNSYGEGFIAHELAEVCPLAVIGEKDATKIEQYEISPAVPATYDEEGNELTPAVEAVMGEHEVPVYQGIDTSFLVATLTAAIQEQQALITQLTERITALEGK